MDVPKEVFEHIKAIAQSGLRKPFAKDELTEILAFCDKVISESEKAEVEAIQPEPENTAQPGEQTSIPNV